MMTEKRKNFPDKNDRRDHVPNKFITLKNGNWKSSKTSDGNTFNVFQKIKFC